MVSHLKTEYARPLGLNESIFCESGIEMFSTPCHSQSGIDPVFYWWDFVKSLNVKYSSYDLTTSLLFWTGIQVISCMFVWTGIQVISCMFVWTGIQVISCMFVWTGIQKSPAIKTNPNFSKDVHGICLLPFAVLFQPEKAARKFGKCQNGQLRNFSEIDAW